jgi:hypothetical protein
MLIQTSKTREKIWRGRAKQCDNLRRVFGGSGGMTDENFDKLKYLEKRGEAPRFTPQAFLEEEKRK